MNRLLNTATQKVFSAYNGAKVECAGSQTYKIVVIFKSLHEHSASEIPTEVADRAAGAAKLLRVFVNRGISTPLTSSTPVKRLFSSASNILGAKLSASRAMTTWCS